MRHLIWTLLWLAAAFPSKAAAIAESFDNDPKLRGWRTFGNGSLFQWEATNQNLEVTWDSSFTNSLFYRPLGTVLAKSDDFSFSFDLCLRDIAIGVNPEKPYTFEIALGLCKFSSITNATFFRGAGVSAAYGPRNLVEFDYFPDSGFGATIAPTVVSTNNAIRFSDNHPLELTPKDLFHVQMSYTASNRVLRTTMTRNGTNFVRIYDLSLAGFPDFRVDTFAVISYSDAGQSPSDAGSILAHGIVDNINWTVPDPPLIALRGVHTPTRFRAHFYAVTNWLYRLEVTRNFQQWYLVTEWPPTTNGPFMLEDTEINPDRAFYRVLANRP
ncbi:MAG TPA: hypothetical protein VK615_00345 [Candidatus Binatia bacterium]|nr:hypothetical protein [Candidatus Binatia bacterium]